MAHLWKSPESVCVEIFLSLCMKLCNIKRPSPYLAQEKRQSSLSLAFLDRRLGTLGGANILKRVRNSVHDGMAEA